MAISSEEDFIRVVQKAEQQSRSNLSVYKAKLTLFAVLGYAVIFGIVTLLIALVGGMVGLAIFSSSLLIFLIKKKFIFVILFAIWTLLRALWVKIEPVQGYELSRKDYPELYDEIDALTKQLQSLKIHKVILDRNLNAAVIQRPRFGIFGINENTLVLGLQLLLTLSPAEMRSVLAHEFGHLSGNHSRFNGWIYRVRRSWQNIMQAFGDKDSFGAGLMRRFFNWYAPQFSAYSFALARNNEYEADGIAAELTSPEVASQALINVHITAPYIDSHYWDEYFRQADELRAPSVAPFEGLKDFLKENPLAHDELLVKLDQELQHETHYADTHPSLKDRVAALGVAAKSPVSSERSAAEEWLGESYHKTMNDFDHQWLEENKDAWKNRYEYVSHAKTKLAEYKQNDISDLDDEALWSYAYWSYEFSELKDALPLFQAYQFRFPQDPSAAYYIGYIQLEQNDDQGLDNLRKARKHPNIAEEAARMGFNYLISKERQDEADSWWTESISDLNQHNMAQQERNEVSVDDQFDSRDFNEEEIERIKDIVRNHPQINQAWITQKFVEYYPEHPVYILAFKAKGFSFSANSVRDKVAESLDLGVTTFVVSKNGETKKLAKKAIKNGIRVK